MKYPRQSVITLRILKRRNMEQSDEIAVFGGVLETPCTVPQHGQRSSSVPKRELFRFTDMLAVGETAQVVERLEIIAGSRRLALKVDSRERLRHRQYFEHGLKGGEESRVPVYQRNLASASRAVASERSRAR